MKKFYRILIIVTTILLSLGILALLIYLIWYKHKIVELINTDQKKINNDGLDIVKQMRNNNLLPSHIDVLCSIPIFVINLPMSKDRLNRIKYQMNKYKINFKFVTAVDGKNIQKIKQYYFLVPYKESNLYFYNNSKKILKGELGCVLSHINTIIECYHQNIEIALILEDDIDISYGDTWDKTIKTLIRTAPKEWEYLSIGSECDSKNEEWSPYGANCFGCQSYIINRKGMKKILDTCMNKNIFILDTQLTLNNKPLAEQDYQEYRDTGDFCSADLYIPYILQSYFYKYPLLQVNNNHEKFNSLIHPHHTKSHISQTIKFEKQVVERLNKRIKELKLRRNLIQILKIGTQIMTNNNIPYWLYHGTLLGIIRDNNLIVGDEDVDCCIPIEFADKLMTLKNYFEQKGFILERHDRGVTINKYGIPIGEDFMRLVDLKTNKHLDIGLARGTKGFLSDPSLIISQTLRQTYKIATIFPLKQVFIFNQIFNIPNDYNTVNFICYNDDCYEVRKTPKESNDEEKVHNIYTQKILTEFKNIV